MKNIKGVLTALVTPFKNNEIDYTSLVRLIHFQLQKGVEGFVVNGTTAESPTLSDKEVEQIFTFVKAKVNNHVPLILGTGTNSTQTSIEKSKQAEAWGADAVLTVVPYYNKPQQEGLFQHFKKISEAIKIPLILYNVPSRTITNLEIETIKKLSNIQNIIGIKEATGNIEFAMAIKKECRENFLLLSGDDGTYEQFCEIGGHGIISVASHIIPEIFLNKKTKENKKLIDSFYLESNPAPIKMALYLAGIIDTPELRLPLVQLSEKNRVELKKILTQAGIIK